MTQHRKALLWLAFSALAFILPALLFGPGGTDYSWRGLWQEGFSAQFRHGVLYPRWLPAMMAGCGSPVFFFYPPLAFYLSGLAFGLSGWHAWLPGMVLFSLGGGWFFYRWLSLMVSPRAALVAACLYVVSPYRILEYYVVFNPNEALGVLFLPLLLYVAERMRAQPGRMAPFLAAGLALMLLSNLPLVLVVCPAVAAYMLVRLPKDAWKRYLGAAVLAAAFSLLLSASFLLPMLSYQKWIAMFVDGSFWEGQYAAYKNLFFGPSQASLVLVYRGIFLVELYIWGILLWHLRKARPKAWPALLRGQLIFWLSLALAVTLLLMQPSAFLWKHLPLLSAISFAPRLMRLTDLALLVLLALLFDRRWLASRPAALSTAAWIGATYLVMMVSFMVLPTRYSITHPEGHSPMMGADTLAAKYEHRIELSHSYMPRWSVEHLDTSKMSPLEKQNQYGQASHMARVCPVHAVVLSGNAHAEVLGWWPRHAEVRVAAGSPATLRLSQFFFPGWSATRDGKPLPVAPSRELGLIEVKVPKGISHLSFFLNPLPEEAFGGWISWLGWVIWLGWIFTLTRKRA
jgi:hypothetical protein